MHSQNPSIIIARTLKNDNDFFIREEDMKVLLKLRKNRLRIGSLSQDLLSEDDYLSTDETGGEEIIENLKAIDRILDGVRQTLNEL